MTLIPKPSAPGTFPLVAIRGNARQRGLEHGRLLADRIRATVAYYLRVFRLPQAEVLRVADHFRDTIRAFDADYAREIDAIAEGAGLDPLLIYALNARTELLAIPPQECTAVYFQKTGLLGQNWDFAAELEDLTVVMSLTNETGHQIRMLTEPGLIGKIGLNSCGIGVCLNLLSVKKPLRGVPIHILLRAVLDSRSLDEARRRVTSAGVGTASNILVADAQGGCFDLEFTGDAAYELAPSNGTLVHTNHYLASPDATGHTPQGSSHARYDTAVRLAAACPEQSMMDLQALLGDQSEATLPICRPFATHHELGPAGTLAGIVMDLPARRLLIRRGPHPSAPFEDYGEVQPANGE